MKKKYLQLYVDGKGKLYHNGILYGNKRVTIPLHTFLELEGNMVPVYFTNDLTDKHKLYSNQPK